MRHSLIRPDARAHRVAGRLFLPIVMLMAGLFVWGLASTMRGVAARAVAHVAAADSAGLVR
jgi:hypothetical protein